MHLKMKIIYKARLLCCSTGIMCCQALTITDALVSYISEVTDTYKN